MGWLGAGEKGLSVDSPNPHTDLGSCTRCYLPAVGCWAGFEPLWACFLVDKVGEIVPPHKVVGKVK